ncbi:MAG: nitrate/sulfonate/bicarbonate ABC transporter ATP-binding protein [Candidatus Pacebacteria bacterium]|nr:nitrate/sulfonate/bicarbonate ABC transporter ATP-binding protein [Candidatus Paceibacterota bacterium]
MDGAAKIAEKRELPILEVKGVRKAFPRPDGSQLLVLDEVDLSLKKGEIVGLLGRSGSGKSTLLRTIAGLTQPSSGQLSFKGQPLTSTSPEVTMVFQNFALFPWLSVLENVQLGLEARGDDPQLARVKALKAIELIGLSGFESAYPKELSGGMRQRVGFARALVVDPTLLLMDEPFSALDVLTAETLRSDFLELWHDGKIPISAILIVTHNIEEAVLMCDRVMIFTSNPGRIGAEVPIQLPHPRDRQNDAFRKIVDDIYVEMTMTSKGKVAGTRPHRPELGERLPAVTSNEMIGLLESLDNDYDGRADLPQLAQGLQWEIDDLFPVAEGLQWFGLADVSEGDIVLTASGRTFVEQDITERKKIFAQTLLTNVPLAAHIVAVLNERPGRRAPWSRFLAEIEDHLAAGEADTVLDTVIEWGRFAEVFQYNDSTGILSLEEPEA